MKYTRLLFPLLFTAIIGMLLLSFMHPARAEDSQDLAKKLANPVASLISIPFDLDYDHKIGPVDDGDRLTLIAKPVIPITLNKEWNLISRTIVPLVTQDDILPGSRRSIRAGRYRAELFLFTCQAHIRRLDLGRRASVAFPYCQ